MPIAIDPREPYEYVLECDRKLPDDEQTKFVLKVLTLGELANLEDSLFRMDPGSGEAKLMTGSHAIKILKLGLRGWRNFNDANQQPVEFETRRTGTSAGPRDEVTDSCLERLHPDWRRELANAITSQAKLNEEERKN